MPIAYLDNGNRARVAILGCGVYAVANTAHIVFCATLAAQYGEIENTAPYERAESILGVALIAGVAFAGIAFLFWFRRAYANAQALGLRGAYTPGWAVGGWFVPILNLVRPAQIAFEMWRHAGPTAVGSNAIVGLWWTAFLVDNIGSRIGTGLLASSTMGTQQSGLNVLIASDLAAVLGLVLAMIIVQRLTKAHTTMQVEDRAETFA